MLTKLEAMCLLSANITFLQPGKTGSCCLARYINYPCVTDWAETTESMLEIPVGTNGNSENLTLIVHCPICTPTTDHCARWRPQVVPWPLTPLPQSLYGDFSLKFFICPFSYYGLWMTSIILSLLLTPSTRCSHWNFLFPASSFLFPDSSQLTSCHSAFSPAAKGISEINHPHPLSRHPVAFSLIHSEVWNYLVHLFFLTSCKSWVK